MLQPSLPFPGGPRLWSCRSWWAHSFLLEVWASRQVVAQVGQNRPSCVAVFTDDTVDGHSGGLLRVALVQVLEIKQYHEDHRARDAFVQVQCSGFSVFHVLAVHPSWWTVSEPSICRYRHSLCVLIQVHRPDGHTIHSTNTINGIWIYISSQGQYKFCLHNPLFGPETPPTHRVCGRWQALIRLMTFSKKLCRILKIVSQVMFLFYSKLHVYCGIC